MKTIALCLLLVACGKKAEDAPKAQPGPKPDPVAAETDAAVAVIQAVIPDAEAGKRTATVDSITDGTATMTLLRNLVDGSPPVKVTMKLPAGWKQSATRDDHAVIFVPEGGRYDRPSITMNVQMDNLDSTKLMPAVVKAITDKKTQVVGGGKVVTSESAGRPAGRILTRQVDATKERDINYVETICYVTKPGQPFVVQMLGFVDKGKDDEALAKTFHDTCLTVTIVEP